MKILFLFFLAYFCSESGPKLIVHEWGTYTSSQGSNGVNIAGLHHGEENLPEFVHSRADTFTHEMWEKLNLEKDSAAIMKKRTVDGIVPPPENKEELKKGINCGFCKVMDWIPTYGTNLAVTQKLETPVIYFYSQNAINNVNVTVRFPQGIVTEVYPQTTKNLPQIGNVQALASGHAEWTVNVLDRDSDIVVPEVEEDSIWAPSRRVNSNKITSSSNENEKHIFYRGLGRFDGPLSVKSNHTHMVIENNENLPITAAWILATNGQKGFIRRLQTLSPRSPITEELSTMYNNPPTERTMAEHFDFDNYLTAASVNLEIELTKAGLFELEARAMVDTWSSSYFKSFGVRVLYIAPSNYAKVLLPLTIQPRPTQETRVLVGRVEVLLKSEEETLGQHVDVILQHYQSSPEGTRKIAALLKDTTGFSQKVIESYNYIKNLGRFAESKIRRAIEVSTHQYDSKLIEEWVLAALTY